MREVVAAGAVVFRGEGDNREVCLVHRPRYDDWSLPKGKRELGESTRVCAVREVREEAGLNISLSTPLTSTRYPLSKSSVKIVHWWRADIGQQLPWTPGSEIDAVRWLGVDEARSLLSYDDERGVLDEACSLPPSVAIALVRHGKALPRQAWGGPDPWRPLNARGRNHSRALVPELSAYGIVRLVSSPSTRCRQTLGPFARHTRQCIEDVEQFSEEFFEDKPRGARIAMDSVLATALAEGLPTAVCGHRPVLPTMAKALGINYHPLKTGQVIIAHVGARKMLAQEVISHTVDSDD